MQLVFCIWPGDAGPQTHSCILIPVVVAQMKLWPLSARGHKS